MSEKMQLVSPNVLPSRQLWVKLETNRLLLEPRKQVTSTIFRLISIAVTLPYAPLALVAIWAALIFGASRYMGKLINDYSAQLIKYPNLSNMTVGMANIVRRYKQAWLINCVIWGLLSGLSQFWLPETPRFVCIIILNALMFLSITRTCVNNKLMHRVSAILIFSQAFFIFLRFMLDFNADFVNKEQSSRLIASGFYLSLMSYLLYVVGNRFNQMHVQRLDFEYSKLQLIETLRQREEQLHIEQKALISANKLVQQFYSGAAHDLRQPVYAMQLYTSMLAEDTSLSKVLLPKITQSCISINEMFNTLFDYQQSHMNDTELLEKDNDIEEIFKSLALHFQPIAAGKGLQIRFRPIAGSITMVPLYLTRILSNLIANALRYTDTGGVLVAARKSHACFHFEVWDTGIGIDHSKLNYIFNEFYKVNKVDVTNEGLGLGLAIAKQLSMRVEQTDISVKSRLGRGSVFTLTVPIDRYKPIYRGYITALQH